MTLIPGDGVGPEMVTAVQDIFRYVALLLLMHSFRQCSVPLLQNTKGGYCNKSMCFCCPFVQQVIFTCCKQHVCLGPNIIITTQGYLGG